MRCLRLAGDSGLLVSGSWDGSVRGWDTRTNEKTPTIGKVDGKVYAMDARKNLVVAVSNKGTVFVFDVRKGAFRLEQTREASLRHQIRDVAIFPDEEGFVLASVEGRVAVEFVDPSPQVQENKYAFKCHRGNLDGVPTAFPVNAIAFNEKYGTFATGGCDQTVCVWDGQRRKKISQLPRYPSSISSLDFNYDGTLLAIASSYTFEQGEKE